MHVERYGTGPRTFLGLHGWSGDHRTFLPLIHNLPGDVSFFSADLPGCGASALPCDWTLGSIADDIAELIWQLPEPVTLVGNCSGGLLGIEAAKRAGSRVQRMVLIDVFAMFPWYFRVFLLKPIGPYAYATVFRNPIGRWVTNLSLRAKRAESTTLTGAFAEVDHAVTYRYLQLFENFPALESFAVLTQPVDLLYGEKTFAAVRQSVLKWQSVWPQAAAVCLQGAGHLPIEEATGQLRGILYHQPNSRTADGGTCRAVPSAIAN
jgi:pimeloyl-ACP methyl ester carboxylesterase